MTTCVCCGTEGEFEYPFDDLCPSCVSKKQAAYGAALAVRAAAEKQAEEADPEQKSVLLVRERSRLAELLGKLRWRMTVTPSTFEHGSAVFGNYSVNTNPVWSNLNREAGALQRRIEELDRLIGEASQ